MTETQIKRLCEIFTKKARRISADLESVVVTVVMDTLMLSDGDITYDEWIAADESD